MQLIPVISIVVLNLTVFTLMAIIIWKPSKIDNVGYQVDTP